MKVIKKIVPVTRFEKKTVGFELEAYVSRYTLRDPYISSYDNFSKPTRCTMSFDGIEIEFSLQDSPDAFQLRELVSGSLNLNPSKYKITIEKEEVIEEQSECRKKNMPTNCL